LAAANKNLAQANKTFGGDCRLLASNGGAVHLVVRGIVKLRQTRCWSTRRGGVSARSRDTSHVALLASYSCAETRLSARNAIALLHTAPPATATTDFSRTKFSLWVRSRGPRIKPPAGRTQEGGAVVAAYVLLPAGADCCFHHRLRPQPSCQRHGATASRHHRDGPVVEYGCLLTVGV
jgi:hypothetical protein